MDGSLEESVSNAISKIQPVRTVFFRRSQLIQDGVVIDDGPTLEQIKAEEKAAKESQESAEMHMDDATMEGHHDLSPDDNAEEEAPSEDDEPSVDEESDYDSMTVSQLKELLKNEGKPVSGKKADLIARLME